MTVQNDTIIVALSDYVRWNELWLTIEKLAGQWGNDDAHGSELLAALVRARILSVSVAVKEDQEPATRQ